MRAPGFLTARIRGFRIVNLLALTVLLVIALASYALKTLAGAQDAGEVGVETQITQEQKRIRMLQAEISTLGGPQRVADLSRQYLNLGPPDAKHDITEDALPAMAAQLRNPPPALAKGQNGPRSAGAPAAPTPSAAARAAVPAKVAVPKATGQ
jgi:cell division protein FtsL